MDLVWYTAYGSNLHADRLAFYLSGGQPPGGRRTCPGCRDPRPPRRTVPVMLPGGVYFALDSLNWGGGMAFYDDALPGQAAARGYLVTASQFADILAQEMHRPPGIDQHELIAQVVAAGRVRFGPGRYETLVCAGSRDGYPLLTFTAPWRAADVTWNPPTVPYLSVIASGLRAAHGWPVEQIVDYLSGRPGVEGQWSTPDLEAVVSATFHRPPPLPYAS